MLGDSQTYDLRLELRNGKLVVRGFEDVVRAQDKVRRANAATERSFQSLNRVASGLFTAATLTAIAYGTKKLVDLGNKAEETQWKFDQLYASAQGEANEWAGNLSREIGRAETKLKDMASTLLDLMNNIGFAERKSMDMSKSLVRLAIDVASFNNVADDEVINNFTSALVGNHMAVRKYGILLTESTLAQEALNSGITKNYSKLTELEKVQLRYNLIQKKTVAAHGDATRWAGAYGNQMVRLQANLQAAGETLGTALMPPLTDIVTQTNLWIQANTHIIEQLADMASWAAKGSYAGLSQETIAIQEYINDLEREVKRIGEMKTFVLAERGGMVGKDYLNLIEREEKILRELAAARDALVTGVNRDKNRAGGDAKPGSPGGIGDMPVSGGKAREIIGDRKYQEWFDQEAGIYFLSEYVSGKWAETLVNVRDSYREMLTEMPALTEVWDIVPEPDQADLAFDAIYDSAEGFRAKMVPVMSELAMRSYTEFELAVNATQMLFDGFSNGITGAFAAMASGSGQAADQMASSMLGSLGQIATMYGQFMVLAGSGLPFLPGGQKAAGSVPFGIALLALGGTLQGLAGRLSAGGPRGGYGGGYGGGEYGPSGRAEAEARPITIIYYADSGRFDRAEGAGARRVIDRVFEDRAFAAKVKDLRL